MATFNDPGQDFSVTALPYFEVKAGGIPNWNTLSSAPSVWMRKCGGKDYSSERSLLRNLITDVYNKHGVCMIYYVVSFDTQYNKIWGEDNDRRYERRFEIMSYFHLQNEEKMWTKFAIEGIDSFSIFISKDHFRLMSTYGHDLVAGNIGPHTYPSIVPKSGDILMSKFNSYLYEIINVKEEAAMFLLNKNYVWELTLSPLKDEHIGYKADTSASILSDNSPLSAFGLPDRFEVKNEAFSAAQMIKYHPAPEEREPVDSPFGEWN